MYYQEIKPGVFVSNEHKVHYALDKCPYCGDENTLTHHKYTNMCVDCGNIYNLYSVRRSRRLHGKLTLSTARAHLNILEDMLSRHAEVAKVQDTFDEELTATRELVDSIENNQCAVSKTVKAFCKYCGAETRVRASHKGIVRCGECQETYNRYRSLCRNVELLDERGCDELAGIIRAYISSRYATPRVSSVIPRLQRRIAVLGGDRQIFYYKEDDAE